MILTIEDKKLIAAGSAFLEERLSGGVAAEALEGLSGSEHESELLERWKRLTSDGPDCEGFRRRIGLTKKALEEIIPLLESARWNDEKPLPGWMETLELFFSHLPASYGVIVKSLPAGTLESESRAPFQHAWAPWLLTCLEIFKREAPQYRRYVTEKSMASWLGYILEFFNKNFALCLTSAFDLTRFTDFMFFSRSAADSFPEGSRIHYDEFCGELLDGGWLDLLKKYPVAARLISTFCSQQAVYFANAVRDLENDMDKISKMFNSGADPGMVKNLEAGLSDHHNGGRSVIKFEFESDLVVFYKPRPGDIDTMWTDLLGWLERKMPELKFKTPAHIEGDGRSWVKNIPNSPLAKKEDAGLFYYKAGAILAFIYVLGGTDFHQENLIADGADPVLIDLETILNPLVKPFNYSEMTPEERNLCLSLEGDSVLRTCMLPLWTPISPEVSRDYGALTPDDNASYSKREWLDVNTDRMRRGQVDRKVNPSPNVAHFNGELVSVIEYKEDILKGFEDVYRLLMNERGEFLAPGGPLKTLHGARMRYLPRQSQVYGDMIDRLRSPGLMRSGAAFAIEAEGMARPFLNNVPENQVESLWKIYDGERRSILFLNIPLFEFTSDRRAVFDKTGMISEDYYLKTAIEEVERRAMKLSPDDMEFQSNMIDASLLCRYPDKENKNSSQKKLNNDRAVNLPEISREEYLEAAGAAAREIAGRVIYRAGRPHWLTLKSDPVKHINFIGPVDITLYEGASGIGLFLAAYEKITGDVTHRKLALQCFDEIKEMLGDKNAARAASNASPGYCGGMSGIIWALQNAGKYLGDEELISLAGKAAGLMDISSLEKDNALDVIGGSAGGALTAIALYDSTGEERFLELAKGCAENLISRRFKYEKWDLWPSNNAYKPLTGFAHGASGYALALALVYERTRVENFREAALEAMDYETANYRPDYKNWPDYRHNRDLKPGEIAFMGGWCSGAPGVGLARLKMPLEFRDARVNADIENSIAFVNGIRHSHELRDHLCCGYSGRIDFLIEAAALLKRPQLMKDAQRQFSFIVNRARKNGRYTLTVDESKSIFTPGLFTGLAGIGYTALRLLAPESLPTVLAPGA